MFTLLSGRPPFTANSVEESLRNLTSVPAPRITSVKPDVPIELDDLISRMMCKRPEDRIPTAQALIHQLNSIEESLRDAAEARTAHQSVPDTGVDTFAVGPPQTVADTRLLDDPSVVGAAKTEQQEPDATAVLTEPPVQSAPENPVTKVNFFNTVTDQLRDKQTEPEVEVASTSRGVFPLAAALVIVVLLGIYGVYAATRPPSAESLFTTIEENAAQPDRVLAEIDQFIEIYPDESRIDQVKKMRRVGEAIRNFKTLTNTLTVRLNSPGGLTEVEQQFMDIVELAEKSPDVARAKMEAFVTFHSSQPELSQREHQCIAAATGFPVKLDHERKTAVLANLTRLRSAMQSAKSQEDKQQAIKLYESIIELYRDVDWGLIREASEGRQMVADASRRITELRQAIERERRAEQEKRDEAAQDPDDEGDDDATPTTQRSDLTKLRE